MQAFPSLSAALMMLCRATAVSPWQVCKWEPQQTALGPGSEECQEQDGRRGDRAHSEAVKRISTQDTAPRAPTKLDTIFN